MATSAKRIRNAAGDPRVLQRFIDHVTIGGFYEDLYRLRRASVIFGALRPQPDPPPESEPPVEVARVAA